MEIKKIIISKELVDNAIKLSSEWNNTGYIVKNNLDDKLSATVWNHWKWENPQREIVASVNCEGITIDPRYEFEV